jgi:hypothetical protein
MSVLNDFIGRKILDCEYQLKAYCIGSNLNLAIMEMNDVNIDVEDDRLCCWINDNGMIQKFTRG